MACTSTENGAVSLHENACTNSRRLSRDIPDFRRRRSCLSGSAQGRRRQSAHLRSRIRGRTRLSGPSSTRRPSSRIRGCSPSAFDLIVADATEHHPRGVSAAYSDIGSILRKFDFDRIQGSVYVTEKDDMANLFAALLALKALDWFPKAVRDIRGFKIENWSDFTPIIKGD